KLSWTKDDFRRLLDRLGCAGYGWLRPEGVRRELEKMAADWRGPPPLEVAISQAGEALEPESANEQYDLGMKCQDPTIAATWFRKAAMQGNELAQDALGQ